MPLRFYSGRVLPLRVFTLAASGVLSQQTFALFLAAMQTFPHKRVPPLSISVISIWPFTIAHRSRASFFFWRVSGSPGISRRLSGGGKAVTLCATCFRDRRQHSLRFCGRVAGTTCRSGASGTPCAAFEEYLPLLVAGALLPSSTLFQEMMWLSLYAPFVELARKPPSCAYAQAAPPAMDFMPTCNLLLHFLCHFLPA